MTVPPLIRREFKEYSEKHRLSPQENERLLSIINAVYQKSTYDPEEPIGVVTAQSLSEPATQMTMRTYHFAGTAGIQVTLGLPRMIEIFDARKEPRTPTMTIHIDNDQQSIEQVKKIAEQIKEVKLKDIVVSDVIDLTDMWIKCRLDPLKVREFDIDAAALPKKIKLRGAEASYEGGNLTLKSKNLDIRALYKMKYALLETHIKGIKGVSQVVVTKEEDEWVINTLGSNLKQVFEIEGVDYARSFCNNMFEMYEVLGVEAGRTAIINQAQYTVEEQGLGVDVRYIMLLADLMTVDGEIKAIGRYGISGQKASVLVRASFEETKKHLVAASVRGEKDQLKGAIENIILNQLAPIGTGAFDLIGRIPEGVIGAEEEEIPEKAKKKKAEKKPKAAKRARAVKPTKERRRQETPSGKKATAKKAKK
jgi:DNA-directed RNA polymerase subunit A"